MTNLAGPSSRDEEEAGLVTEITLQRTECFGDCPVYHVVLRRDGDCLWYGRAGTHRLGIHVAEPTSEEFARLSAAVLATGFLDLEPHYVDAVTCQPSTTTTLRAGVLMKSVYRYGGRSAPYALIGAEDAIDSFCEELEWRELSDEEAANLPTQQWGV